MAMSFEDELRAVMRHEAEQNKHLHELSTGERTVEDFGLQGALEILSATDAMQKRLILRIAKEIDELRAAIDSR